MPRPSVSGAAWGIRNPCCRWQLRLKQHLRLGSHAADYHCHSLDRTHSVYVLAACKYWSLVVAANSKLQGAPEHTSARWVSRPKFRQLEVQQAPLLHDQIWPAQQRLNLQPPLFLRSTKGQAAPTPDQADRKECLSLLFLVSKVVLHDRPTQIKATPGNKRFSNDPDSHRCKARASAVNNSKASLVCNLDQVLNKAIHLASLNRWDSKPDRPQHLDRGLPPTCRQLCKPKFRT